MLTDFPVFSEILFGGDCPSQPNRTIFCKGPVCLLRRGLCRLVCSSSEGCAMRIAEGAHTGFDPASQGAIGSESLFHNSPGEPCPVSRGQVV